MMQRLSIIVFQIFFLTASCFLSAQEQTNDFPVLKGPYLGQKPPGELPEKFANEILSSGGIEFAPAFTPDGKELFFTRLNFRERTCLILTMKEENGIWTAPDTAPFSGEYEDSEPFISPDGKKLFFASTRPTGPDDEDQDANIWYVEHTDSGWSEPVNVGSPVNTEGDERHPSVTENGNLYFHSRDNGDISMSRLVDGKYSEPEKLSGSINTDEHVEVEPYISPNEGYIIFYSAGRNDRIAATDRLGDLYISFRREDGTWTKAIVMTQPVNSTGEENWPWVSGDGKHLFFTSNRDNSSPLPAIYWMRADVIETLKPDAMK